MKVNETFASFQGEISVGRFAYFIRLGSCNLNCHWCDTPYKNEYTEIDIPSLVNQAEHFPRVVITGGEPLLQKHEVVKFIERLKRLNEYKVPLQIPTISRDVKSQNHQVFRSGHPNSLI